MSDIERETGDVDGAIECINEAINDALDEFEPVIVLTPSEIVTIGADNEDLIALLEFALQELRAHPNVEVLATATQH